MKEEMSDETPNPHPYRINSARSPAWNYFTRVTAGIARCDLCKKKFSYKTSITNLKRHLLMIHKVNLGYKVTKAASKVESQIDYKKLIEQVKQHPCLWNINSSHFDDQPTKHAAWNKIAAALCPSIDPATVAPKLSERFASLRERFFADKLRAYSFKDLSSVFHKDLEFLDPNHQATTESSVQSGVEPGHMDVFEIHEVDIKDEPVDEYYNGEKLQNQNHVETTCVDNQEKNMNETFTDSAEHLPARCSNGNKHSAEKSHPSRETQVVESVPKEMKKPPQYNLQLSNADKDVLFLLSFADDMKRVPKDMKIEFKAELMLHLSRLVRKYKS